MKGRSSRLIAFQWMRNAKNPRLRKAQAILEESISAFGLTPFRFEVGADLVLFGDLLKSARAHCSGDGFVWCNSDVILTRSPYDISDSRRVYGFHRREVPSGEICGGVDMYYIPVKWWDEYLSRDVPKLYLGASYVDWWLSRAMAGKGAYKNLTGYIDHVTHPRSGAAADDANPYYQKNFRAYNAWAKRNGAELIEAPPFLVPRIGHVWGFQHAVRRVFGRK